MEILAATLEEEFLDCFNIEIKGNHFIFENEMILCEKLVLPTKLRIIVQLANNLFREKKIITDIQKISQSEYCLRLYKRDSDGNLFLTGEFNGKGPSALNLAYMKAVIAS